MDWGRFIENELLAIGKMLTHLRLSIALLSQVAVAALMVAAALADIVPRQVSPLLRMWGLLLLSVVAGQAKPRAVTRCLVPSLLLVAVSAERQPHRQQVTAVQVAVLVVQTQPTVKLMVVSLTL